MSASAGGLLLMDFTAYEVPTDNWMRLVRPKMRLRVRVPYKRCEFVSSTVKVGDRSAGETGCSSVRWPWNRETEQGFPQPCFSDDDVFEVEIERRFLLRYKCIRRTKPVTLDQVRTGDLCALSLYDGRRFAEVPEERAEIGEITFALRGADVKSADGLDGSSSEGKVSLAMSP